MMSDMGEDEDASIEEQIRRELDALDEDDLEVCDIEVEDNHSLPQNEEDLLPDTVTAFLRMVHSRNVVAEDELKECDHVLSQVPDINALYLNDKQLAEKIQETLGDDAEGDPLELKNKVLSELEEEDISDEKEKLRANATEEIMALDIIRPDVIEEIKAQEAAAREKLFRWEEEQRKRDEHRQTLLEERKKEEELRNEREQKLREQKQKELEEERQTFNIEQQEMSARLEQLLKQEEEHMELLYSQLKEEIKVLEKEKEKESENLSKMREEEARITSERNNKAATNIQKHFRRMRIQRQYKPILDAKREARKRKRKEELDTIERVERKVREKAERKRKEEEEKKRLEKEEKKLREEREKKQKEEEDLRKQEKKRREEEARRKREEEEARRREEEEAKRRKEEERLREEQERKRKEMEEQKIREEKKRLEEEEQKRKEEQRRKDEEERERKRKEEKTRKMIEEEEKRKLADEEQRVERERQRLEKEQKEKKLAEERRMKEEEERKRREEERKRLEEEKLKEVAENVRKEEEVRGKKEEPKEMERKQEREREGEGAADIVTSSGSAVCNGSGLDNEAENIRLQWLEQSQPWSPAPDAGKVKVDVTSRSKPRRLLSASRHPQLTVDQILQASPPGTSLHKVVQVILKDLRSCNLQNLQQCPSLKFLSMDNCGIVALNGLDNCTELHEINMPGNKIELINNINLRSLEFLNLEDNNLTSVHGLERCQCLRSLDLKNNKITRLAGLQGCPLLQDLMLDNNQLITVKGLASLRCLQTLSCVENHLTQVADLEDCGLLNRLCLQGNNLHQPPSLINHVLLKELLLDDNSISDLEPLSKAWLPSLQVLSLSQNSLSRLSPLKFLIMLQTLDISNNIISDLESLLPGIDGCPRLKTLKLEGNPVNEEPECRSRVLDSLPSLKNIDDNEVSPNACELNSHDDLTTSSYTVMCIKQSSERNTLEEKHQNDLKDLGSCDADLNQETVIKRLLVKSKHFKEMYDLAVKHRRQHEEFTGTEDGFLQNRNVVETRTKAECTANASVALSDERSSQVNVPGHGETLVKRPSRVLSADVAATKIQSVWRGWFLRHQIDVQTKRWLAAVSIQAAWRGYSVWREYQSLPKLITRPPAWQQHHHQAATLIQAAYKGHLVRRRLQEALSSSRYKHWVEDDFDYDEEVDLSAFDFDESTLDTGWTPAETPMIPTRRPVLPTPPQQQKVLQDSSSGASTGNLPWMARQAWRSADSPVTDTKPPLPRKPRVSPDYDHMSVTSAGKSSKQEELTNEWGFRNSGTAELMMKRAKRMKKKAKPKNAESRLALFKKLDESNKPLRDVTRVMPASRKAAPRVDYFAAKEFMSSASSPSPDAKAQMTYSWVYNQAVVHEDEQENLMSGRKDFTCEESPSPPKKSTQAKSGSPPVSLPFMDRVMLSGKPVPLVTNQGMESNPQSRRQDSYDERGDTRYFFPPIKSPSVPNLVTQGIPSPPDQPRETEKSNSAGARISRDRKARR